MKIYDIWLEDFEDSYGTHEFFWTILVRNGWQPLMFGIKPNIKPPWIFWCHMVPEFFQISILRASRLSPSRSLRWMTLISRPWVCIACAIASPSSRRIRCCSQAPNFFTGPNGPWQVGFPLMNGGLGIRIERDFQIIEFWGYPYCPYFI